MTEPTSKALQTALAYYQAWTNHDFDRAMSFIAADIVCYAPPGRLDGAEAFRGFMEPFTQIVTRSELLAAFGDDQTALLMYDTGTVPVHDAPGAECLSVVDGSDAELAVLVEDGRQRRGGQQAHVPHTEPCRARPAGPRRRRPRPSGPVRCGATATTSARRSPRGVHGVIVAV